MSTPTPPSAPTPAPVVAANPAAPPAASAKPGVIGSMSALEHTGLPPSLLRWKPRLPSRNWTIFLSIVGGVSYLYFDDRRKCNQIKQEYIDKVKHLAEVPLSSSMEYPRKVTVYAAKWPEDDDYERGLQYFKRYLKPVLVAAAVDYELVPTGQYGSLTRLLHDKILSRRRQALGLESAPPTLASGLPGQLTPEQKLEREVDGGVVLIGRHTLKEYMEGLKRGWMGPVNKLDREGDVAKELEFDGVFEEKPAPTEDGVSEHQSEPPAAPAPATPSPPKMLGAFAHLQKPTPAISSTSPSESTVDPESLITPEMHQPPSPLPQQPAMLLVPWINHLGFKQIPYMFIGLFTESKKYREGGEAALKLILGPQRDFVGSEYVDHALPLPSETATGADSSRSTTDLDFDLVEETWYKKAFDETPASIEKHRKEYYEHHLKPKLQAARELAAGTREPTKEEVAKPPPSEAELKAERLKKEFLWWKQLEGYEIVKRGSRVPWDERWTGWLKVFETPETSDRLEAVSNEDL